MTKEIQNSSNKKRPSVSVITPALNEEKGIKDAVEAALAAFDEFGIDGEVVVVNDGSRDETQSIAESLMGANPGRVRLINHAAPQGMGASFWDGARAAAKEAVTLNPGDNENDPREILKFTKLLSDVDMIVPYVYNKEVRQPLRNIISSLYTFIINTTFRTSFKYTNGTIIFKRSILDGIECRSGGFFFLAETLIKAAKRGHLFTEVPYALSKRAGGVSKAVSLRSLVKVMKGYLGLVKDIYFTKRYSKR